MEVGNDGKPTRRSPVSFPFLILPKVVTWVPQLHGGISNVLFVRESLMVISGKSEVADKIFTVWTFTPLEFV